MSSVKINKLKIKFVLGNYNKTQYKLDSTKHPVLCEAFRFHVNTFLNSYMNRQKKRKEWVMLGKDSIRAPKPPEPFETIQIKDFDWDGFMDPIQKSLQSPIVYFTMSNVTIGAFRLYQPNTSKEFTNLID